ncbi:MAG: glutathione-disulfide reductase [Hyphomicrobiales bacterium]|nr:glutathione-disulfide reductase [Hyphomicrobiales bacterium]
MTKFDVDLFVIGAGSGGVRAARVAAGLGAKVMITEQSRIGGTCVIRGCVPKKLLVYASRFPHAFEDAVGFGFSEAKPEFSWERLRDRVEAEVTRLSGLYRKGLEGAGVAIREERAEIIGPHEVRLASGQKISAGTILVATGGRPSRQGGVVGADLAIVSDDVFHLPNLPRRMIVVGAGYIALEFASVFAGLGTEVHLVHRGDAVLRGFDEDLRRIAAHTLAARGVKFHFARNFVKIELGRDGIRRVHLQNGETLDGEVVLIATGRVPNTNKLGLENAGLVLGEKGEVEVDAQSRSNVPSVYAIGDVTNRLQLTPVAIREGHAFAESVFGDRPWTVDHADVPSAVFITPEIGTVGLTQAQACEQYQSVDVYVANFRPMLATLSERDEKVFMKLLVDGETDKVLGLHISGEGAGEMVQLAAIAIKMGATKADFDRTVALHPTAAEEIVTMRTPAARLRRDRAKS